MADAAITFAVKNLGDALTQKVNFLIGVEDQVRWLKDELESMQCFLKDATEKQGNNEYGNLIRKWICDVREVAQDAEDVIDMFTLKVDAPTRKKDLVRKWAGFPVHLSHLNRVGKKIKSIQTRLQEIRERRVAYGIGNLGEVGINESSSRNRSEIVELRRRMAARLQKDKDVVGLKEDVDLLLKKVILDQGKGGLSLAAIIGMGGIGKTTQARKIYNHPDIAARFEKRAWVVVSSEFAAEDIMKQIMHELSVPLDANELRTLESIQGKLRRQEMLHEILRRRLEGKRYFVVLDDVWEHTHWDALETAFPDEQGNSSRLLFTSRREIFTRRHGYIHKMRVLNPDESWELLLKTALNGDRCPQELEDIGRKILEKCHGLPLAITLAGGLLVNHEESKTEWDRVLKQMKNYNSEASEIGKSVLAILELSYHNFPSQLKPCFLCLAFFKEDAVIRARRLVHIWVAQGLVKVQEAGEESVEEIARSYLDELISRNLVQVKDITIDNRVKYCHVHDLLSELSIKKAKEEIGFESLIREDDPGSSSSSKPRHLIVRGIEKRLIQMETSKQNKHLRSIFIHVECPNEDAYFSTLSYLKGCEPLRILDIEGSRLQRLPSTVRELIGIRYLRLREKGGLTLPTWLDVLKNLEVLDVANCEWVAFPDVTWKMISLRHLYVDGGYIFSDSMKKSSWPNLETLKYVRSDEVLFPVQRSCHNLRKLGIQVTGMHEDAEMARLLVEYCAVQILHLRWSVWIQKELPIPNSLDHLTKLKLVGRMNRWFPTADKYPQSITHLTLSRSLVSNYDNIVIQELGKLPNLLALKLDHAIMDFGSMKVSREWFPMLKLLHLKNMRDLHYIVIEEGGMAELQRMQFQRCPNLKNVDKLRERIRPIEIIITDNYF